MNEPYEPKNRLPGEDDEPRWFTQPLDKSNVADLLSDVVATLDPQTPRWDGASELFGIVDDEAGGIVAYAVGEENADRIAAWLNDPIGQREREQRAKIVPLRIGDDD